MHVGSTCLASSSITILIAAPPPLPVEEPDVPPADPSIGQRLSQIGRSALRSYPCRITLHNASSTARAICEQFASLNPSRLATAETISRAPLRYIGLLSISTRMCGPWLIGVPALPGTARAKHQDPWIVRRTRGRSSLAVPPRPGPPRGLI